MSQPYPSLVDMDVSAESIAASCLCWLRWLYAHVVVLALMLLLRLFLFCFYLAVIAGLLWMHTQYCVQTVAIMELSWGVGEKDESRNIHRRGAWQRIALRSASGPRDLCDFLIKLRIDFYQQQQLQRHPSLSPAAHFIRIWSDSIISIHVVGGWLTEWEAAMAVATSLRWYDDVCVCCVAIRIETHFLGTGPNERGCLSVSSFAKLSGWDDNKNCPTTPCTYVHKEDVIIYPADGQNQDIHQ